MLVFKSLAAIFSQPAMRAVLAALEPAKQSVSPAASSNLLRIKKQLGARVTLQTVHRYKGCRQPGKAP